MSTYTIDSIASLRPKIKETYRVETLLPSELRDKSAKLLDLLKDYYDYLNRPDQPSYITNNILNERDLDTADVTYLDMIQKEIAVSVPKAIVADRVKLYKNLVRYYSIRGSQESIELFFKILFNDLVEVYYPQKDMLIPSSGGWDAGQQAYIDNKGFLSDSIKLQDSFFYQKFSYVIRTGNNVDKWKNSFNRLVHPAGFIFFGEILIYVTEVNEFTVIGDVGKDAERIYSSMRKIQPGLITDLNLPLQIILEIVQSSAWMTLDDAAGQSGYIPGEIVRGSVSHAVGIINSYYTKSYDGGSTLTGNAFLTTISGTFTTADHLVGDISHTTKQIASITLNSGVLTASLNGLIVTVKLDVPTGTDQSEMMKFFDDALIQFYGDVVIQDATTDYQYNDYTIADVINNTLTVKGSQLGVTFI